MKDSKYLIKQAMTLINNNGSSIIISLLIFALLSCEQPVREISLAGDWQFQEDPNDVGIAEDWMNKDLDDLIELPASMAERGKGDDVSVDTYWTGNMWNDSAWYTDEKMAKYRAADNVKVSFWLTPQKVYYGPAWYKKEIVLPENWENDQVDLLLERPHWETMLWINGQKVGMRNTLGTPHQYTLSEYLKPGINRITLRVDNRIKEINPGLDAHSISDNTQSNWNGIVGEMKLIRSPKLSIDGIQVYPDVAKKQITIKATIKGVSDVKYKLKVQATAKSTGEKLKQIVVEEDAPDELEMIYSMGENPMLWDEFSPNLYALSIRLESELGVSEKQVTFGMRDFQIDGKRFAINGRPVFLRGTLECAIFPLTGYPPTDVAEWKRIFDVVQNHGLNHVRFHSWCPPEAAFQAADEMGVYLQAEASAWTRMGDGAPIDQWVYEEAESIIATYGNHPSFVMMAYGNEPHGPNHKEYLTKFVDHMRELDDRRLYTGGAGYPFLDNLDFYNHAGPRIQGWAKGLTSIINSKPPQTEFDYDHLIEKTPMPYVSHEMGQWCVYPNFKEMSKYTGVLQPRNFEIFKETLEANAMGHLADSFHLASGKLQALCYKADIEAALRTKDMAGFQLLDLHDFPGQGTALVGVLDPFWDSKDYISAEEFKKFNDITVPLARLSKRTFTNDEQLIAEIEVAHYGAAPLNQIVPSWKLVNEAGELVDSGELAQGNIPIGNGTSLGSIAVNLNKIITPTKLTLEVEVAGEINDWEVWVYPASNEIMDTENDYQIVELLSQSTLKYLENGGSVLLNISKGDIASGKGGDIGVGFSSIFWNTSWTRGQKPHTLGILCDPQHPALAAFPTEYHSNWQWWDAVSNANAIVLDDFPIELNPIVRLIDDWFENRRTALIFEVKVGEGKLLFSGIDLHSDLENRLEARQLRYSLEKYVGSKAFNPKLTVSREQLLNLFVK